MKIILGLLLSYIIGSIPTAFICGKIVKKIDIRQYGSGNVGATNAFRVLGKRVGIFVLFFDVLKGLFVVTLIGDIFQFDKIFLRVLLSIAVVSGHNWTVFLKFKGGKGMATSLGVLIGLAIEFSFLRPVLFICLIGWLIIFLITGYVSLSSIFASVLLPVSIAIITPEIETVFLGVVFCLFIVIRHRSNLKRLFAGTENRVKLPFHKNSS